MNLRPADFKKPIFTVFDVHDKFERNSSILSHIANKMYLTKSKSDGD